ncbi:hypothetical protein GUJ93_ZPchr0007g4465 [Zizania palustris]|uniref:Uncharacterized protein n=1 Tax=Zizania palustris TaxID=103762 RepID=A0A8J5T4N5_ZIZPA|nr:hypothetical protein GUJ93_ZPchr0007g4465 [Zizania palustris]
MRHARGEPARMHVRTTSSCWPLVAVADHPSRPPCGPRAREVVAKLTAAAVAASSSSPSPRFPLGVRPPPVSILLGRGDDEIDAHRVLKCYRFVPHKTNKQLVRSDGRPYTRDSKKRALESPYCQLRPRGLDFRLLASFAAACADLRPASSAARLLLLLLPPHLRRRELKKKLGVQLRPQSRARSAPVVRFRFT